MNDADRERVEAAFALLCESPDPTQEVVMEQACGADDALRKEVVSLLSCRDSAFLAVPMARIDSESLPVVEEEAEALAVGEEAGSWRITGRIGAGGMATVYAAERMRGGFAQRGALKVIRRGLDTAEVLARFRREREILSRLEHPNIARLIDGGMTQDGRPFLVMEHVEGDELLRGCDEREMSIVERVGLIREVCDAVQFAHQKLVVHRDIKPGNILLTSAGTPKLLDFGIASLLERPENDGTITVQRRFTPRYASPEQARGEAVTVATDVYALGAVLGELVSVATMGRREESGESRSRMTATEKRRGRVDGDLQTIVLKATHEQPERRYASAAALSDDLTRWLERRPIAARTDSLVYRARRFVARNPAATLMGTIAAASLVAGLVIVSVLVIHAGEARDRAREETRLAEGVSGFLRTVLGSIDPEMAQGRDVGLLVELLEDAGQKIEDELGDMPRAAIPLHITIGSAFKSIARYEPARDHFERAEAMSRLFMAGSLMHAEAVEALATLDLDTDRYEQARTHLATARSILEQHVETGGLVPLARVLRHTAHLERALADYQSAEATCRLALNLLDSSRHRTSLTSDWKAERAAALMEHGVLLATQWRAEEAIAAVEEAMQILLRLHGDQHPQVARASYNLGWANRRANNPEEAEYWYRQALALNQRLLHDNHPDIASSMNNLAGALEEQGEFQEAEALYVEAIERMQRILGARHVDVATAINNLGGLYRKTGRSADALRRFSEANDIYKEVLGADHPWIAIVAESAAATLESADDLPAARTWVQECVRIRSGRHDAAEQWMLERARTLLGLCMMADGETDAGLAMLEEARAFLHAHRPEGDATRTAADRRWAAAQALLGR